MKRLNTRQAGKYALTMLSENLLPQLHYHSREHTQDEVVPWTEKLADSEGIHGRELDLLMTAAYFHDTGWIRITQCNPEFYALGSRHEEFGAEIARKVLPDFGYEPGDIIKVCDLILATRVSVSPQNGTEAVLQDADLATLGLGVDIFWKRGTDLRMEMAEFGLPFSDGEWLNIELKLLDTHRYHTESARRYFDQNKQAALESLRRRME